MNKLKIPTNLETISLNEQTNYRLIEIGKIKDKMLTAFLTVFSGTNVFAHAKDEKRLLELITSGFSLVFCLSFGVVKKLLYERQKEKKSHNKLRYIAKNKLDCIEMLISKSLEDGAIDDNKFTAIINEKKN